MTQRPRTIQIFLPAGDPRGIRVAALTTNIVQVIEVPRPLMSQFLQMPESRQVGVYYLIGDDEEKDRPAVYIGQTGALGKRLNEHDLDPKREFWNRALVAISLTHSLTQTHAMYLEWRGIQQANSAQRYLVENGNAGSKPHTPAWLEADCQEIFDTIRTLVATMGQPVFEPLATRRDVMDGPGGAHLEIATKPDAQVSVRCKGAGVEAVGDYTEEGMVILKGSRARADVAKSMIPMSAGKNRQRLIDIGDLRLDGESYVFQRDVLFGSPSGASDVVLGRSSNGWMEWKDSSGKTLDELKRQKAVATGVLR
ncbi:GIY-YIG nuclease family protein [Polaromonas sp.]|uniref:GIY-YIG nuclease family protein n=1 Tax=Polaromonas sp. TaxID=1869339 RepID=UPI00272F6C4A|nr:GIY-YIG nuclease family protein [Polaromonas sp.]MDP1740801.1 GIY-YIG nuclease family protein [Polaromonas sp.]